MSLTKRLIDQMDEQERAAVELLVRVDALKRCDTCGDVTDNYGDLDEGFNLGESLMAKGDPLVACFEGNKESMRAALQRAQQNSGEECHCAYLAGKDD